MTDLERFDRKCVRVTLTTGEVLEGFATYNDAEYDETIYGTAEEGLDIARHLIYAGAIADVQLIDEDHPFSGPYGKLEEDTVKEGMYFIEDALECAEPVDVIRLIAYLRYHMSQIEDKKHLSETLKWLIEIESDQQVKDEMTRLKDQLDGLS